MRFSVLDGSSSWVPELLFFRKLFWDLALQVLFLLGTWNNCEQTTSILDEHVKIRNKNDE